ncbi:hypothetical protein NKJ55_31720 [Mesorhizobium sp. M0106]|uniref:hypothetical protein n=1 Tax=Mesorhizobium sp. M0106 TaxID=2956880 RepID=UPI00333B45B2
MPASEALLAAVAKLDMIDLCGRIVADPERNGVRATTAEVLALAMATEGLWAIALETRLLISALDQGAWASLAGVEHQQHVAHQLANVRDLLAFMPSPIPYHRPTGE